MQFEIVSQIWPFIGYSPNPVNSGGKSKHFFAVAEKRTVTATAAFSAALFQNQ